jgi:hypothetical protein
MEASNWLAIAFALYAAAEGAAAAATLRILRVQLEAEFDMRRGDDDECDRRGLRQAD